MSPLQPSSAPKHTRGLLVNLLAQMAFGLLAMTICLPSMQEWSVLMGGSQASVQLTFSSYVVAYGVLQLFYGPLSDRIGRKRALLLGLGVAVVGSVWAVFAASLPTLTLARAVQGAGCAAGTVVGRAMVQDFFSGPQRTRVMAYVGMVMGLCPPLATVIGGQVHVHLGWQANFVMMALLGVGLSVAAWRGLPSHVASEHVQPHWLRAMGTAYARLARERTFLLFVVMLSMTSASFYAFLAGAPLVLGTYGVGPGGVGFYIMLVPLSYIVGNYLTSRLAMRRGDRSMMMWGQVCTVSGIVLMGVLAWTGVNAPLAFAVPLMLTGFGNGFLVPPTLAGTVGLLPALAGAAAAVAGLMQQLMGALGGFGVGLLPHADARNLAVLMLGFALVGVLAQWALGRQTPLPPGPTQVM
jgi:MFS transporter, DHA1 family, multidrug resistance protein